MEFPLINLTKGVLQLLRILVDAGGRQSLIARFVRGYFPNFSPDPSLVQQHFFTFQTADTSEYFIYKKIIPLCRLSVRRRKNVLFL